MTITSETIAELVALDLTIPEGIAYYPKGMFLACEWLAKHRTALIQAAREAERYRKALEEIAQLKTCDDEPGKCTLDSGPYCGQHSLIHEDKLLINAARTALAPQVSP